MNLQYDGRPVSWFGVGAPDDVVSAGIATLQGKAVQLGGGGGYSPTPPPIAVAGLKSAGTAAVNTVGPAIDALSGNNPDVMRLTQQAWQLNRDLAAVDGREGVGRVEVDTAKRVVDQMLFAYKQAANLASSIAPKTAADGTATSRVNITTWHGPAPKSGGSAAPPALPAAPPTRSADTEDNTATWIAVAAGVFVLVVGGVIIATRG